MWIKIGCCVKDGKTCRLALQRDIDIQTGMLTPLDGNIANEFFDEIIFRCRWLAVQLDQRIMWIGINKQTGNIISYMHMTYVELIKRQDIEIEMEINLMWTSAGE